ncbi:MULTISPECIES: hypothetical protein [Streptomonospora]|uniref:DUF4190 domain-containing protein n=2 Tax=Streptomonospora TaxID=104204 RepID=A0ABV9SP10_9ACTN
MNALLYTSIAVHGAAQRAVDAAGPLPLTWNPEPQLPSQVLPALDQIFAWGRGIVAVIGIIGVLYCAGKMVVGKSGRSDLAAEGVGGLLWTFMGIFLMLVAVSVVTMLLSTPADEPEYPMPTYEPDPEFTGTV